MRPYMLEAAANYLETRTWEEGPTTRGPSSVSAEAEWMRGASDGVDWCVGILRSLAGAGGIDEDGTFALQVMWAEDQEKRRAQGQEVGPYPARSNRNVFAHPDSPDFRTAAESASALRQARNNIKPEGTA